MKSFNPLKSAGHGLACLALMAMSVGAMAQSVVQPERVPFQYGKGKQAYEANCSQCHGQWGGGSEQGPPLMHPYYKPSHHSDAAFAIAIKRGTFQHHWNFGPMEPVPDVAPQEIPAITAYVRWLQVQNGIE